MFYVILYWIIIHNIINSKKKFMSSFIGISTSNPKIKLYKQYFCQGKKALKKLFLQNALEI